MTCMSTNKWSRHPIANPIFTKVDLSYQKKLKIVGKCHKEKHLQQ